MDSVRRDPPELETLYAPKRECLSRNKKIAIASVAAVIFLAGAGFLAYAAFKGIPNVNVLNHTSLGYGLFGAAAGLSTASLIGLGVILRSSKKPSEKRIREISSTEIEDPNKLSAEMIRLEGIPLPLDKDPKVRQSRSIHSHHIFGGLHLGRESAVEGVLDRTNKENIKCVISAAPLFRKAEKIDYQSKLNAAHKDENIKWVEVGNTFFDAPIGTPDHDKWDYWFDLAYNCTLTDEPLAKCKYEEREGNMVYINRDGESVDFFRLMKTNQIKKINVQLWFEPIFKLIDQAVNLDVPTLVHCQAGESRSATLLAAYLINRYNVSAEDAIAYLCSKRQCVRSNFMDQLKGYENDLKAARS